MNRLEIMKKKFIGIETTVLIFIISFISNGNCAHLYLILVRTVMYYLNSEFHL